MNLARHSITATSPVFIFDAQFDADCNIFTATTPAGFAVYRTWPLKLLRTRGMYTLFGIAPNQSPSLTDAKLFKFLELTGGTLAAVVPLHTSSLLFLLGGGRSPLYPPNKVILWDEKKGAEVAELEFRERVRGLSCRRGWLAVALKRRVVVFEVGEQVTRHNEYDTCDNPRGLLAMATAAYSTLLAIPGRQTGHVQLIHLPPCKPPTPNGPPASGPPRKPPPAPSKHPVSIIVAHTHALTTISLPPSGRIIATSSSRGTLVRIWDALTGKLVRELRRGSDKAVIYGVAFRPDEREMCVWSDKGTIHVFSLHSSGSSNRQSSLSQLTTYLPLPKYFESEWSYAQYRIPTQTSHITLHSTSRSPTADVPDEERCTVGWISMPAQDSLGRDLPLEPQLVALTYTGGWYRLSLPNQGASTSVSTPSSPPKGTTSLPKSLGVPRPRTASTSSVMGRHDKGKEKQRDKDKESGECVLREFRRFGRWDGWG